MWYDHFLIVYNKPSAIIIFLNAKNHLNTKLFIKYILIILGSLQGNIYIIFYNNVPITLFIIDIKCINAEFM